MHVQEEYFIYKYSSAFLFVTNTLCAYSLKGESLKSEGEFGFMVVLEPSKELVCLFLHKTLTSLVLVTQLLRSKYGVTFFFHFDVSFFSIYL